MVNIAKSSFKKIFFAICRVAVTMGILLWVFRSPDLRENIREAFAKADAIWILIGLPVAFGGEVADMSANGICSHWDPCGFSPSTGLEFQRGGNLRRY